MFALTSVADEDNVRKFYGKLQELVEQVPNGSVLIRMGDLECKKVGEVGAPGIAGKHGLDFWNEWGKWMLD